MSGLRAWEFLRRAFCKASRMTLPIHLLTPEIFPCPFWTVIEPPLFLYANVFVAEDGKESLSEDFSKNIEYYLFAPKILKAKNPTIYDWIQKEFGDKLKQGRF